MISPRLWISKKSLCLFLLIFCSKEESARSCLLAKYACTNNYLPTGCAASKVCKSVGEPIVNLVQGQLTVRALNNGLRDLKNYKIKPWNDLGLRFKSKDNIFCWIFSYKTDLSDQRGVCEWRSNILGSVEFTISINFYRKTAKCKK